MSDADAGEVQRSALADFAVISVDGFKPTNAVMLITRKNGYLGPSPVASWISSRANFEWRANCELRAERAGLLRPRVLRDAAARNPPSKNGRGLRPGL
ncbi:MAG: hypothetical protein WBA48_06795, partial [Xanthobacteraceae bacterium]